jgi:hypothetical protein
VVVEKETRRWKEEDLLVSMEELTQESAAAFW